jgi:hypothetical protein
LLLSACRRGVPVYSLAVDWLAEGLAMFADNLDMAELALKARRPMFDDDLRMAELARRARRLSRLTDPMRAFTVLRIPPKGIGLAHSPDGFFLNLDAAD